MRLSKFFLPILKENPKEASIASHRLMLRTGMIRSSSSGIYSFLPLGVRALHKVSNIIREELDAVGCQEVIMPTIQSADLWRESGRYDDYGKEMLRIKDRHDVELLYGPTHEEVVTDIFRNNVKSYKDLPLNLYQIHWKFRDEIRPRFGILRGREFLMKDAYSFDLNFEGALKSYNTMFKAYLNIFNRIGVKAIPVSANSGAIGGNLSHEFHIVADTGESEIFYDRRFDSLDYDEEIDIEMIKSLYSAADERHDPKTCTLDEIDLRVRRGIEVGHIFYFGTKYSKALNATVTGPDGKIVPVEMGSYGIGASRILGAVIEACHNEKGIKWPDSISPFTASLINLKHGDSACTELAEKMFEASQEKHLEMLYDDTDQSAGSKLATHDLLGFPYQIIIGSAYLKDGVVELKDRIHDVSTMVPAEMMLQMMSGEILFGDVDD